MAIRDRIPPGVILLVLAPMIGELLSGSSPPSEFFTLFGFTIMTALWWGALLARELKIRWGKGLGTLLLLGASYGVIEEGVMVGSWFNPRWPSVREVAGCELSVGGGSNHLPFNSQHLCACDAC